MKQAKIKKNQFMLLIEIFGLVTMILFFNLIGNLGMFYFAAALEVYLLFDTLFLKYVPEYMEKMVRSRMGKEQYQNADKVIKTIMPICLLIGFVISVLLFSLSDVLACELFGIKEMGLVLILLSPAFFFSAIGAGMQGYFQGLGTAMPSIVFHTLKRLFGLTFSMVFGYILLQYGKNVAALLRNEHFESMYATAGVALGMTLAVILADLFLGIVYLGAGRRAKSKKKEGMRLTEDSPEICKQFLLHMIPDSGYHFLLRLPIFISILFCIGKSEHLESQYGAFYVQYLVVLGILIYSSKLFITNKSNILTIQVKKEETKNAKNHFACGLQALLLYTCFFVSMTIALYPSLSKVLFKDQTFSVQMMQYIMFGGIIAVLVPISQYFAYILIETGKRRTAIINNGISLIFYFLFLVISSGFINNRLLIVVMGFGVLSLVSCLLNGFFLFRLLHYHPDWFRSIILSAGIPILIGIITFFLRKWLVNPIGDLFTMLACFMVGSIGFIILLYFFRCIREKDFDLMPCGAILKKIGNVFHML